MPRPGRETWLHQIRNGRPTSITEELIVKISGCIRRGLPVDLSVIYCGCAKSSYYLWLEKAEKALKKSENNEELTDDDLLYILFSDAIKEAEADFLLGHIENVNKHSKEQWTASAWMLERRARHLFGKVEEVQNPNQAPALIMQDSK